MADVQDWHWFTSSVAHWRTGESLTKTLNRVSTEMSLHVLAYNLKRVMNILGVKPLIQAIQA